MITRHSLAVITLIVALACGNMPQMASTATPAPVIVPTPTLSASNTPAPTIQIDPLPALIEQVDADRLKDTMEALAAIPSRHVNSATIGDAAEYIKAQFEAAGLEARYQEFPLTWEGVTTVQRNVIASLPGSDPDAGIVLVGAHYDSRVADLRDAVSAAPGATDNASGVAAVIELARLLAGTHPRSTIQFVAFSAEEVGRVGSKYFVQLAQTDGLSYRAMIALDMVGNPGEGGAPNQIRAFSAGPEGSISRMLAHAVADATAVYLPDFEVVIQDAIDRPRRYSDHNSFSEAGYPAMRLIQMAEDPDNHTGLDTPDKVSPEYMAQAAKVALIGIVTAAFAE
jgi:Zn-dependent M28 family amino/carboxypeptidase